MRSQHSQAALAPQEPKKGPDWQNTESRIESRNGNQAMLHVTVVSSHYEASIWLKDVRNLSCGTRIAVVCTGILALL